LQNIFEKVLRKSFSYGKLFLLVPYFFGGGVISRRLLGSFY